MHLSAKNKTRNVIVEIVKLKMNYFVDIFFGENYEIIHLKLNFCYYMHIYMTIHVYTFLVGPHILYNYIKYLHCHTFKTSQTRI